MKKIIIISLFIILFIPFLMATKVIADGGDSLIYKGAKFEVYDTFNNIWIRTIKINDTIASGTILSFPHSIVGNEEKFIHPIKVIWENESQLSYSDVLSGIGDTNLYQNSSNFSDIVWKTPLGLANGHEVKVIIGKYVNWTSNEQINRSVNISRVPLSVVMNISIMPIATGSQYWGYGAISNQIRTDWSGGCGAPPNDCNGHINCYLCSALGDSSLSVNMGNPPDGEGWEGYWNGVTVGGGTSTFGCGSGYGAVTFSATRAGGAANANVPDNNNGCQYNKRRRADSPQIKVGATTYLNYAGTLLESDSDISSNMFADLTTSDTNISFIKSDSYNAALLAFFDYNLENPIGSNISIVPSPAGPTDDLNCTYDYEGYSESNTTIEWFLNNSLIYSTKEHNFLNENNFTSDDKIICNVTVSDGTRNGTVITSAELTIADSTDPYFINSTVVYSTLTENETQLIFIEVNDSDSSISSVKLSYTQGDGTYVDNVSMTQVNDTFFNLTFIVSSTGIWYINSTYFTDGSGNNNYSLLTDNFTVSASPAPVVPGGGGGAPDLAELGESCTDNSDCLSLLCDTMVTLTCVETLCGNGFCDESSGESINNCAQDCTVLNRFDWSQATFARWAFYFFIGIIFILIIEPDFWGKSKKYLIGGRRRR